MIPFSIPSFPRKIWIFEKNQKSSLCETKNNFYDFLTALFGEM